MDNKSNFNLLKQSESFNFIHHKDYDVSEIKKIINGFNEEYSLEKSRQYSIKQLRETSTFFMKKYNLSWKVGDDYDEKKEDENSELWSLVNVIVKDLEDIHQGKVGQVVVANLPAKKDIYAHFDPGDYLGVARRNHIPIITNKDVIFDVAEDSVNMKEGECWEINNNKIHRVANNSEMDRIHLTIDIIPNQYLR
jgi:aspartyl/asparaginyl beta-hydroxylase (cupin superfamily)